MMNNPEVIVSETEVNEAEIIETEVSEAPEAPAKEKKSSGFLAAVKERIRKLFVSLKRKPHIIPGLVMAYAFLLYSLNMTDISDTTARIQGQGMGLCGFATMLLSILSFVCFLNAFPHRKKVNIPMLLLMFVMFAVIIFCDYHYIGRILNAVNRAQNPIQITDYISKAYSMLNTHMIVIIVSASLIVLLPVYSWLLRKINTSIDVEGNESMGELELSEEE